MWHGCRALQHTRALTHPNLWTGISSVPQDFAFAWFSANIAAMEEERIAHAMQRIEAAKARLQKISAEITEFPANLPEHGGIGDAPDEDTLATRHAEMKRTVTANLDRLDAIIERLEA